MGMAMCRSECPSSETCYRQQRKPHEYRQAYMIFTPDASGKCGHYVEATIKSGDNFSDKQASFSEKSIINAA